MIKMFYKIKDARLLGVEKDTENRYSGGRSWNFNVSMQGWRYHMSNIMAAIGLEQLKKNSEFVEKRRMLAKCYDEQFRGSNYVSCFYHDYDEVAPHIYAIRIKGGFELRKGLQEYLLKHGVQTGVHYQPNHWLSLYESEELYKLPITEQVYSELLSLPLHPELSKHDIKMIGTLLGDFFKKCL